MSETESRYFPEQKPAAEASAPKRRGRRSKEPKVAGNARGGRAKAPVDDRAARVARAMDGWGNPLRVKGEKGWDYYWCTAEDLGRFNRPWVECRWGTDPVEINGVTSGKPGEAIVYKELRLYKMREAQTREIREMDPNRLSHELLWEQSQQIANTGVTAGARGPVAAGMAGKLQFTEVPYSP
jgi:hypothetical protein